MEQKKQLRIKCSKLLRSFPTTYSEEQKICENILELPELSSCISILLYKPLADEINISPIFNYCVERNIKIFLPVPHKLALQLAPERTVDPSRVAETYDCLEREIKPDLAIIPGLGFARNGARLGRGGGWYDRMLAKLPERMFKIGVINECCFFPDLPQEKHDKCVNLIVTQEHKFRV